MSIMPAQDVEGVDLVEDGLLVFLEVAVVRERQGLEDREEGGQVTDEAPGLAARELCDVGVLLLRHDGRAGRVGVVQGDVVEFLGVPDDDLLAQAGDVDADLSTDEGELGDDVARGGAVDGVFDGVGEAEGRGDTARVHTERIAGQRAGAVGRDGGALIPVAQASHVAQERPHVSKQVVGDEDGLGVLHMGATRHDGVARALSLADEGLGDVENAASQVARLFAQVDSNERGDLVVARAARAELPAKGRAGAVNEAALQGRVHVLIIGAGHEGAGGDVFVKAGQRVMHVRALLVGEQTDAVQLVGVRVRAGNVDVGQSEIEVGRHAQRCQGLRRAASEATTPQGHVRFGLRHGGPPRVDEGDKRS